MPKFDKLFRKLCPNENFGSLTSIFDVNFTQNLRNIELSQAKRLSYLLELYFVGTFQEDLRKILGTDFPQSPKNCQKWPKMAFFRINSRLSPNRQKSEKSGRATFLTFFTPNFVPGFGKILGAVSEIIRDTHTHGRTILILQVPLGFQPGTKKVMEQ